MAEVLVLVEHTNGEVKKVTAELLTIARRFGTPSAVFVGSNVEAARPRLAHPAPRRSMSSTTPT